MSDKNLFFLLAIFALIFWAVLILFIWSQAEIEIEKVEQAEIEREEPKRELEPLPDYYNDPHAKG